MTLEDLAVRIARLEEQQARDDLLLVRRDIADLAAGIGTDFRSLRSELSGIHADVAAIRGDISEIRRLLQRGVFRWPWES